MAITGIFGLPGQGKTYEGVRLILQAAEMGRKCYSVTPIKHPNVEQIEYDDVTDPWLPPGLIFLDEVHLVLSYTVWARLDAKWFEKLSQTRKDGHDLIYTSQHHSKVLKQLRDNTNWGWKTRAWGTGSKPLGFSARMWEMDSFLKGKAKDTYFHRYRQSVADAYQTTFAIKAAEAAKKKITA